MDVKGLMDALVFAAAWCPEEEIQAERDLLQTYRERLREADITINNLNAKLAARPSQSSVHRHQNGTKVVGVFMSPKLVVFFVVFF